MSEQPEYLFALQEPYNNVSDMAQATIHLGRIAERLATEPRTLVNHVDGRAESVAEHSNMLGIVATALAEEYFPDLDSGLIAKYCDVHDIVEAYVGDTPTHRISEADYAAKEEIEMIGLTRLEKDFEWLPSFVAVVKDYEGQTIPEARFVKVCDKLMPLVLHFAEGGATLREHFTAEEISENSAARAKTLRERYSEFEKLIALREELSALAVRELLRTEE